MSGSEDSDTSTSTAVSFTPGNHDTEWGRFADGIADNLAVWATGMRKKYLPNLKLLIHTRVPPTESRAQMRGTLFFQKDWKGKKKS